MRIALLSLRKSALSTFCMAMESSGFQIDAFGDAWSLLKAAPEARWNLVVLDAVSAPFRPVVEALLNVDAGIPVAVLSAVAPEGFHAESEGLGILQALPSVPSLEDVPPLLERLRAVGRLDPRIESAQHLLDAMTREHHAQCVVCWDRHPFGLKVDYRVMGEHTVEGAFACGHSYQGYTNVVHGGIVSSLLDGAMASCTLAKGIKAYTVDMRVRFRGPVETGIPAVIRGEWVRNEGPIHLITASILQEGKVKATARAKFFEGSPGKPSQPMPTNTALRGLLTQARKRAI